MLTNSKKDPSIHIKRSDLITALEFYFPRKGQATDLADELMKTVKSKSITSRSAIITNERMQSVSKKILASTKDNATLFYRVLYAYRRQMKHRNMAKIKAGSKDWTTLKEVTKLATDFSEAFGLEKKEGYHIFIDLGFKKMSKFALFKYLNMYEGICDSYEAQKVINESRYKTLAQETYKIYNSYINDRTGMVQDYEKQPEKFQYFIMVAELCVQLKIEPSHYIKAQFENFAWRDTVPDPIQLVGDKAKQRLNKYLFKNGIKVKQSVKKSVDWSKILRDGDNTE